MSGLNSFFPDPLFLFVGPGICVHRHHPTGKRVRNYPAFVQGSVWESLRLGFLGWELWRDDTGGNFQLPWPLGLSTGKRVGSGLRGGKEEKEIGQEAD